MTQFYIDGKWVELDELVEKAKKWDSYLEHIKDTIPHVSLDDYEILEDRLEDIKAYVETFMPYHSHKIELLGILDGSEFTTKDEEQ